MTSAILISTPENNTPLRICKLGCITGIENNISQMVKIEESENFHPKRKRRHHSKWRPFLKNFFFAQNTLYKSWEGSQNFRFIAVVVKKLLQFESGCGPKSFRLR